MPIKLNRKKAKETNTIVAPVAVFAQGCADKIKPKIVDTNEIKIAHQNILPAERAIFLAVAAGIIINAVTRKTPTAQTEKITTRDNNAAKTY